MCATFVVLNTCKSPARFISYYVSGIVFLIIINASHIQKYSNNTHMSGEEEAIFLKIV